MDSHQPEQPQPRSQLQNKIIAFNIVLNGSSPAIWRRLHVPAIYTFAELSHAIVEAMGWSGRKQHEFQMMYPSGAGREILFVPQHEISLKESYELREVRDEQMADIAAYFSTATSTATFLYDFVDNWQHTIGYIDMLDASGQQIYPICVAGEGFCPAEDIGGIYGYRRTLHILSNPQNPEYDCTKWRLSNLHNGQHILHGTPFDPRMSFSSWIVY